MMAKPHVLIVRAPGTNCDQETAFAFEQAGGTAEIVHINRLLSERPLVKKFQILCIPGGFSYGDDLAAGRILGNQIRHHLSEYLFEFRDAGKLILGICNGFQVLTRSGLFLTDEEGTGAVATLSLNDSGKYEDRWVRLSVAGTRCVFFRDLESLYLPVAHAEGKFVVRDEATFADLQRKEQLFLRYQHLTGQHHSTPNGASAVDHAQEPRGGGTSVATKGEKRTKVVAYPANPNGSQGNVAGVCDETGRVCGLMPHPERFIDRTQHPRWTREELPEDGDGLAVFRNAVGYFQ